MAVDFTANVPEHPPEIGLQTFELATHAFELFGMGVAANLHRCPLGQPRVALAKFDASLLGLAHQGEQCL